MPSSTPAGPRELSPAERRPRAITGYRARRTLEIEWEDAHLSVYGWEYLRWQCPCAVCRGEGGQPGVLASTDRLTAEQTTLEEMEHVGHYAILLRWADGHASGIYSFEYLRRLCPCPRCRPPQQAPG